MSKDAFPEGPLDPLPSNPSDSPDPSPSPEDLENLHVSGLEEVSQELRRERRAKFLDLLSDAVGRMIGGDLDDEKRRIIGEGYREILNSFVPPVPSSPIFQPGTFTIPAMPSLPPSVYTEYNQNEIVTIDFFCLLSRTIIQTIHLSNRGCAGEATLTLTNGTEIELDESQTAAMIRYISAISGVQGYGAIRKIDDVFLSHPFVKSILEETDAEFPDEGKQNA